MAEPQEGAAAAAYEEPVCVLRRFVEVANCDALVRGPRLHALSGVRRDRHRATPFRTSAITRPTPAKPRGPHASGASPVGKHAACIAGEAGTRR